jgi:L-threonylcarbamoyladenylate synthase
MSEVFEVDPADLGAALPGVAAAAEAVARGLLVVLPTETVYGVAARPDDPAATARLFEAKRRPPGLSIPVLAPDPSSAWHFGRRSAWAGALAERFWPGPLTMILRRTEASQPWHLGDQSDTIGLRVPAHALAQALMTRSGPLAATSANLSGHPPMEEPAALTETFGDQVAVYLVLGPGRATPGGIPSTVVDLAEESPRILREGAVDRRRVLGALSGPQAGSTR